MIAVSVHPGIIPTEIFTKSNAPGLDAVFFGPLCFFTHKTMQQGASTYLHAILAPDVPAEVRSGKGTFYMNNGIGNPNPDLLVPGVAQEVWRLSEELVRAWL